MYYIPIEVYVKAILMSLGKFNMALYNHFI